MGKFKVGDLVRIIKKGYFKYGSDSTSVSSCNEGNKIIKHDPDIANSYIVEITSTTRGKSSYRMAEDELELHTAMTAPPVPSHPKQGFRSVVHLNGGMVKDISLDEIVKIPNPDVALLYAINMIRNGIIAGRKFKIGDIVTPNPDLTGLFFGGIDAIRGVKGRIIGVSDNNGSQKVRSQYILVDFGVHGKFGMFESETHEFYTSTGTMPMPSSSHITQMLSPEEAKRLGYETPIQRNQGKVIRAHVGTSVVIPKTRYPQVIISNTKTIIKDGRRDTGRKVQSTHF